MKKILLSLLLGVSIHASANSELKVSSNVSFKAVSCEFSDADAKFDFTAYLNLKDWVATVTLGDSSAPVKTIMALSKAGIAIEVNSTIIENQKNLLHFSFKDSDNNLITMHIKNSTGVITSKKETRTGVCSLGEQFK